MEEVDFFGAGEVPLFWSSQVAALVAALAEGDVAEAVMF